MDEIVELELVVMEGFDPQVGMGAVASGPSIKRSYVSIGASAEHTSKCFAKSSVFIGREQ